MKLIRITEDNNISIHAFPEGSYSDQNIILRELIGPKCELYEHVRPRRLYKELEGKDVCMLVDEEGFYHDLDINLVGSYLYETDKHRYSIRGTILIIGEYENPYGYEFDGIPDQEFDELYRKLQELVDLARKSMK